jgi:hypothetical protein
MESKELDFDGAIHNLKQPLEEVELPSTADSRVYTAMSWAFDAQVRLTHRAYEGSYAAWTDENRPEPPR